MSIIRAGIRFLAICAVAALGTVSQAQQNEILIGHISSTTNPASADNARDLSAGYKLYFDHVNASGGVNGRRLRLVHRDDNLNAGRMVEVTRELIADPTIIALAGFLNTPGLTEIAKQDLLGKSGIAMVSPLQGNRDIVGAENFFPFRSGYPDEIRALIEEAKATHKKRLAVVYMNIAFGPGLGKLADQLTREFGLTSAGLIGYEVTPEKSEASIRDVVAKVAEARPDGVLLVAAGRGAFEFVKQFRATPAGVAQVYAMSVMQSSDLIKLAGLDAARGVIISQAIPYPFSGTLPIAREFLQLLKARPQAEQTINFMTFEGFVGAKIVVEALRRAGPNPTRKRVIDVLRGMGELDLGGVTVEYSANARHGWRGVDMTIIGSSGRLYR